MMTAIIALAYQLASGNITKDLTAVKAGEYYQITNVQYVPSENLTYSVGVRYTVDWAGSGQKFIMHTQPRIVVGNHDAEYILNAINHDNYVGMIK